MCSAPGRGTDTNLGPSTVSPTQPGTETARSCRARAPSQPPEMGCLPTLTFPHSLPGVSHSISPKTLDVVPCATIYITGTQCGRVAFYSF